MRVWFLIICSIAMAGCVSQQPMLIAMAKQPPPTAVQTGSADRPKPAYDSAAVPSPQKHAARQSPVRSPADAGVSQLAPPPPDTNTAPLEEIVVKPIDLSGLWKVNSPKKVGMSVGLFSGVSINYSGDMGDRDICELQQTGRALKSKCLRIYRPAEGSVDGNDVTLRWWLGPANMIFQASTDDGVSMKGTLNGGALGKTVTAGIPVVATKLDLPPGAPESHDAPLLRDVLHDVAAGTLTAGRYATDSVERLNKALSAMTDDMAPLGPVQNVVYIAQILPRHPYDPTEQPLDVYRVSYQNGARLCGISVNPTKVVTDFSCH